MKAAPARNTPMTALLAAALTVLLAAALLLGLPAKVVAVEAEAAEAAAGEVGRVCLAPVSDPAAKPEVVEPGVDYAATDLPPHQTSAEAGTNGEIVASPTRARSLGPLPFGEKQLIKVRADGEIVQAFLVDFADLPEADLCLLFRETRESWALLPASEVGEWCFCDHGAYVPPAPPPNEDAEELEQEKQ